MRIRLTPPIVIVTSALVTASIIAGELALLAKWDKVAATFGLPQLSTATMADGSVLTLHSVSYGKNHRINVPVGTQGLRPGGTPANVMPANLATGSDRLVFFVSLHDPESKEFLDFDAWSHCKLTDVFGDEFQNEHPHRFVYSTRSSRSEGRTSGPFPPLPADDPSLPRHERRILLAVRLPACRLPANPTLDFFDTAGKKVASLPFVSPLAPPSKEWPPETLPATIERDAVSLVVKEVHLKASERSPNDPKDGPRWRLDCRTELQQKGKPVMHWSHGIQGVSDVFGNEVSPSDVTLSRNEPAWRVRFQATRRVEAEFSPDERLTISGIKVLADDRFDTDLAALQRESTELVPVANAGIGNQEFNVADLYGLNRNHSTGGTVPFSTGGTRYARYQLRWRNTGGFQGELLSLETEAPCLILKDAGLPEGTQVLVRTRDSKGNEVPSHIRKFYDFAYLVFFDAQPDVGELTCEFLLQTPVEFELFIRPPDPETENR